MQFFVKKDKLPAEEEWWIGYDDRLKVLKIFYGESWLVWDSQEKSFGGTHFFMLNY